MKKDELNKLSKENYDFIVSQIDKLEKFPNFKDWKTTRFFKFNDLKTNINEKPINITVLDIDDLIKVMNYLITLKNQHEESCKLALKGLTDNKVAIFLPEFKHYNYSFDDWVHDIQHLIVKVYNRASLNYYRNQITKAQSNLDGDIKREMDVVDMANEMKDRTFLTNI